MRPGKEIEDLRNLESTGAENPSTLVLCHVRSCDAFGVGLTRHRGRWVSACRGVDNAIGSGIGAIIKLLLSEVIAIVDRLLLLVEAVRWERKEA